MRTQKNEAGNLLPMTVCEGVTVNILPSEQYEYVMTGKEVAYGYGVTEYAVRVTKLRHSDELIEGKHYVTAVTICNGKGNIPHNAILWTKRGIVRLGFFIKSERAKLFRDWAEELIIRVDELAETVPVVPAKALPKKRNHNRLTSERLIRLLQLTHGIENTELRNEIVNELMGGRAV